MLVGGRGHRAEGPTEDFEVSSTQRNLSRISAKAARLRSGQKRLRRGQEILVAVLVDRVRLRRRFDIESFVRRKLPLLTRAIQKEINRSRG